VTSPSPRDAARPFDGDRAFEHVRRLVEIGPRPAGSERAGRARDYLVAQLGALGVAVRTEAFTARTPLGPLAMANVVAELPGDTAEVILLASHYDTTRQDACPGANDGGSSSGILLELARVLATSRDARRAVPHTVWLAFFDGEEAVVSWTDEDSLYGSRHMVQELRARNGLGRVKAMVLLDMVGDRDLAIPREDNSTPWLSDLILNAAVRLGHQGHFTPERHGVTDDHTPFLRAGVPAVDLIDYRYGTDWQRYGPGGPTNAWWHTAEDTLDKISPRSLQVVGDVVLAALPEISAEAARRSR
jgi:Zn-dependent M28 family amino/carboxypeptidase